MITERRCRRVRNRNEDTNIYWLHRVIFRTRRDYVKYCVALYWQHARGKYEWRYDSHLFMAGNGDYIVLRDRNSDRK